MNFSRYLNLRSNHSTVLFAVILAVFAHAGSTLPDNSGSWLGGSGSNPGNLGQDIRALTSSTNFIVNTTSGTAPSNSGTCP